METKKIAIGYIRVSTQEQATSGYSLDNQQRVINEECKKNGWELVETFCDEGVSGATISKRDGMKSLLQYIKLNKVDYVIVYKISRLGRKIKDIVNVAEYFDKHEVIIRSVEDNFDTKSMMGKIFLYIGAMFAEVERENIITQVKGGMEQRAREGGWSGGKPPIGYEIENKKLIINDAEAKIVKFIFSEYLKGKGYKAIASYLNQKGCKTKLKNEFSSNAVKEVLKNPVYCGRTRWGHLQNWGKLNGENKRHRKYNDNPIIVEGTHTAIIDDTIFGKVQQMIDDNARHHVKRFNGHHLLSGLLRCPDCGYGMSIHTVKSKGKTYEYYECNKYQTYKTCKPNSIRKDAIEASFLAIFEEAINNQSVLNTMLDSLNNTDQQIKEIDKEIKRIEVDINKLKDKEDKLMDELLEGGENYKSVIRNKIEKVANEVSEKEISIQQLQRAKKEKNSSVLNTDEIKKLFRKFARTIQILDKEDQQSLVRMLVSSIEVKDKRIAKINFRFIDGLNVNYLEESKDATNDDKSFGEKHDTVNRIISK